jgi:hypothetical protein
MVDVAAVDIEVVLEDLRAHLVGEGEEGHLGRRGVGSRGVERRRVGQRHVGK